jgi:uncharacterized protein
MTDEGMRDYLQRLKREMKPRGESFVWSAWATTASNLGYDDFKLDVAGLIEEGFIAEYNLDTDDFERQTQRVHGDAAGVAGFEHDHVGPFREAVETLASWSWSAPNANDEIDDSVEATEWDAAPAPYVNPFRGLGRNDPCPCGSGKKYKKCCLGV